MENGHHRKAENKLYQGTNHYTTHQRHILKQNDIITGASFNNCGLYISACSRNPIGSCEQKLPSISAVNGTIDALEGEPLARALSWLHLYFCNFNFEAWKMWLLTTIVFINKFWQQSRSSFSTVNFRSFGILIWVLFVIVVLI